MPTSAPATPLAQALDLAGLWVSPLAWIRLLENWRDMVDAEAHLDRWNVDLDVLRRKRGSAKARLQVLEYCFVDQDLDRQQVVRLNRDRRDVQKELQSLELRMEEPSASVANAEKVVMAKRQSIGDDEDRLRRLRSLLRETAPDLAVPDVPRGLLELAEIHAASVELANVMRTLYSALFEQRRVELTDGWSSDSQTASPAAGGPVFEDCTSFRWGDRLFQFHRPKEREAVRRLWQAHQANGNSDGLTAPTVLGCVGETRKKGRRKVRDLFKHPKRGMNPAWGTLIISVPDKHERRIKLYRLNLTG